ncbi:3-ketoacyl-CoA reductase, partial [Obba rivulosa]
DHPWLSLALFLVGSVSLAHFALKAAAVFLQTFVLPGKNLKKYGAGKGAWAVITGGSDGIGREFALQLAQKGYNIAVAARNVASTEVQLRDISESKLSPGGKVQVKGIQVDFSKVDDVAQWKRFEAELAGLDVGILVNNVGRSYNMPTDLVDTTEEELDNILKINVNATVKVTRMLLPGMVQRKRGLIMFVGSFSGITVVSPMLAAYAGSKSFQLSFAAALAQEVKDKGIDVEVANAYFVVSNMSKIRRPNLTTPTPKHYVRSVLSKIGLACGAFWSGRPSLSTPYWSHALIDWYLHVVGCKSLVGGYVLNLHRSIRKRALRKLEREAKKE